MATEAPRAPRHELDWLTAKIIACAIEVHKNLGPGLLESIYENAMCAEMAERGLKFQRQVFVPVQYKGRTIGEHRLDLLVEDAVVVEVKSVERFDAVSEAQLLTYLKITGKHVGLLINFNTELVKQGTRRLVL